MKFIVTIYENKSFETVQFFSSRFNIEKLSLQGRWLIKKIILSWVKLSLTTRIKREFSRPVWGKPVPDIYFCFCPSFLWFCWLSLIAFGEFIFWKNVTNPLFGWEFNAVQQVTFYIHQDYKQVNFYKKSYHLIIGRSLRDRKGTA